MWNKTKSNLILYIFLLIIGTIPRNTHAQSIDQTFNTTFESLPDLRGIYVQEDGKVIVVGRFTRVNDESSNPNNSTNVVRLNTDGTTDTSFSLDQELSDHSFYAIKKGLNETFLLKSFNPPSAKGLTAINEDGSIIDEFIIDSSIIIVNEFVAFDDGYIAVVLITGEGWNLIKLNTDGSINEDFGKHVLTGNPSAMLRDTGNDQILLLSSFTEYDGTSINEFIKINSDGTLDDSFDAGNRPILNSGRIQDLQIQSDGKILVAGTFTEFNGISTSGGLIRLNENGTIDGTFNPNLIGNLTDAVYSITIADNGEIFLGGQSFVDNNRLADLVSLNADGTINNDYDKVAFIQPNNNVNEYLDVAISGEQVLLVSDINRSGETLRFGFVATDLEGNILDIDPAFSYTSIITDAVLQQDGRTVVSGDFVKVNGELKNKIVRITGDGTIDTEFILDSELSNFENSELTSLAIQDDGKILIGGRIRDTSPRKMIIRLNSNGSLDSEFNSDATNQFSNLGTKTISVLNDGKIIIGGSKFFNQNNQNTPVSIAVLNSDGTVNSSFNNSSLSGDFDVNIIYPTDDEKFLVGGFNGSLGFVKKLNSDGSEDDSFTSMTGLQSVILDIVKIENELIFGGTDLQGGSASKDISAFKTDLNGNDIDDITFKIAGTESSGIYSDLLEIDGDILIGGNFTEINGVDQSNFAKSALNGVINPEFNFNFVRGRVTKLLKVDSENMLVFGSFTRVNDINTFSIAKIKLVNTAAKVTGTTEDLSTNEEELIELSLEDFVIEDPDDELSDMTLTINEGDNYTFDGLNITPALDFNGTLTVPIIVNDGKVDSEIFNLSISVIPVNDAPVISGFNGAITTAEESALTLAVDDLNITDPDNTFPDDYSLSIVNGDNFSVDGSTITPDVDFNGTLTVSVITNDGTDDSQSFDISVEVTPINDAPIITGTSLEIIVDNETPVVIALSDLFVTDPDNDFPSDFSLSVAANDNYSVNGNTITITAEFIGNIVVPITVNDGTVDSEPFNITIEVTEVTGIELELVSKKLDLYPNPVEDILNVILDNQIFENVTIRILDSNGKMVFSNQYKKELEVFEESIVLTSLGTGIYLVELIQGSEFKSTRKIIKK